jgi:hypothetical protein
MVLSCRVFWSCVAVRCDSLFAVSCGTVLHCAVAKCYRVLLSRIAECCGAMLQCTFTQCACTAVVLQSVVEQCFKGHWKNAVT